MDESYTTTGSVVQKLWWLVQHKKSILNPEKYVHDDVSCKKEGGGRKGINVEDELTSAPPTMPSSSCSISDLDAAADVAVVVLLVLLLEGCGCGRSRRGGGDGEEEEEGG